MEEMTDIKPIYSSTQTHSHVCTHHITKYKAPWSVQLLLNIQDINVSFNDNLSPNSEHYQCTKAVFFLLIYHLEPSSILRIVNYCTSILKVVDIILKYVCFAIKTPYKSSITKDNEEFLKYSIISTYNTYLIHFMIQTKLKQFQLRMVLDYV